MPTNISESEFEKIFTNYLVNTNGFGTKNYITSSDYDRIECVDTIDLFQFIADTQPLELAKLQRNYGEDYQKRFLERLQKEIADKGIIEVMRKGVKDRDSSIKLMYFEPNSNLNPESRTLWELNRFIVARQFHYSTTDSGKSLDMVILLNGLPIITLELKNLLTGQTVKDAMNQYKNNRNSREKLFGLNRCLVHFAMDTELVFMTTHLVDDKTWFLPFNKGYNEGAGNPPSTTGMKTGYMWEEILTKSSISNIIQNFVQLITEQKEGKTTKKLIFPRYHQLNVVNALLASAKSKGAGQKYLIQHSAGSGKSNSIAWLAHQMTGLHGQDGTANIFDSIIVITDRRVLDTQLGATIKSFEQTRDLIIQVGSGRELKESLQNGKRIIVSTIQKFPVIASTMEELAGTKFAIIIDEAHSSTGGETMSKVNQTIQEADLEEETDEDIVIETLQNRRMLSNASYFAFTATPKNKTLELFGSMNVEGKYVADHVYTMKQAVEEGFILDVLSNYTIYNSYYGLTATQNQDKEYGVRQANTQLKKYVESHSFTLEKKAEIMLDHFYNQAYLKGLVGGRAKAMLVSGSRQIAAKYHFAFKKIIKERSYPIQAITAFSGDVNVDGHDWNESRLNSFSSSQIPDKFESDNYQVLICANKFQTGFDQPLLQTMYVDKKLGGVNAVQTLSRLNRCHKNKENVFILDFYNTEDEIQQSFAPYYKTTILSHGSNPNKLHDLKSILDNFNVYSAVTVADFAKKILANEKAEQLHNILDGVVNSIKQLPLIEIDSFKQTAQSYIRFYGFISQIVSFDVPEFEELYQFLKLLTKKLVTLGSHEEALSQGVLDSVDFDSYRNQKMVSNRRIYVNEDSELAPIPGTDAGKKIEEMKEFLENIVNEFNTKFGTEFKNTDKVLKQYINDVSDQIIDKKEWNNTDKHNRNLIYKKTMDEETLSLVGSSSEFYNAYFDKPEVKEYLAVLIDKAVKEKLNKRL